MTEEAQARLLLHNAVSDRSRYKKFRAKSDRLLETAVERRWQCVPWGAGQDATRRNSRLFRRVATPPCAPGDALPMALRAHPQGDARWNHKTQSRYTFTNLVERSTAASRLKSSAKLRDTSRKRHAPSTPRCLGVRLSGCEMLSRTNMDKSITRGCLILSRMSFRN